MIELPEDPEEKRSSCFLLDLRLIKKRQSYNLARDRTRPLYLHSLVLIISASRTEQKRDGAFRTRNFWQLNSHKSEMNAGGKTQDCRENRQTSDGWDARERSVILEFPLSQSWDVGIRLLSQLSGISACFTKTITFSMSDVMFILMLCKVRQSPSDNPEPDELEETKSWKNKEML